MTASRPPSQSPPAKRPWYLMAALVASWIYGAQALSDGYDQIAFFRGDRPDIHEVTDSIASADARAAAFAAGENWIAVRESASRREMPFGVASLLLGGAMVLFAARSMAFREGSRSKLVQVVVVHAGIVAATFMFTRDVAYTEAAFHLSVGMSSPMTHTFGNAETTQQAKEMMPAMLRLAGPLALLMSVTFSSLIVVALTRPRARAFFRDPEPDPLGEG
jgi:hypothetical protein